MPLTPFTMLLRFLLDRIRIETKSEQLGTLANTIATKSHMLCSNTPRASLKNLVNSLREVEDWKAPGEVFEFLDHCILHLIRKPVHYYDILAQLTAAADLNISPKCCQVDLVLITIMDQWRFLVESADAQTVTNVSRWLVRFINVINLGNGYAQKGPNHDETTKLLSHLRDQLKSNVQDTTCRAIFETALEQGPELRKLKRVVAANTTSHAGYKASLTNGPKKMNPKLEIVLPTGPPEEHEDHPGLHQWTSNEIQDAVSEGHIKALILCLCSKHVGIRKQALTGIRAFMMKLKVG